MYMYTFRPTCVHLPTLLIEVQAHAVPLEETVKVIPPRATLPFAVAAGAEHVRFARRAVSAVWRLAAA